ncbi:MAG: glycosyltransferase family 2 protein [Bacteroidia bacterium]|nr:glycosyltransferase family 2 protein [Bacteroidia bacterium]
MIYLIHKHNRILEILDNEFMPLEFEWTTAISETLFELGKEYPEELIIWCHVHLKSAIDKDSLVDIFHHDCILASFSVTDQNFIPLEIGYVDQSIYMKVNKKVTYPTWLMSSDIGGIHSNVLNKVLSDVKNDIDFDYFLNSLSKIAMPQGLFCYSEPKLIKNFDGSFISNKASRFQLFKFVKQHYKLPWVFFLMICLIIYDKCFPFFSLINSLRFKRRKNTLDFNNLEIKSSKQLVTKREVEVIIPTLGRKKYLHDVLKDLSVQTILPKKVIIVEQNPDINSQSELDYLSNGTWPYKIKHHFIHQTGACNARNIALKETQSQWVILGDDDNRFDEYLIENMLNSIEKYGVKSVSSVYIQPNEEQTYKNTSQTTIFGSGNSIIKSDMLDKIKFDMAYEFGYGEDRDFGMQIRNLGEDVLFDADINITHLKAPQGGFRSKMSQIWDGESVQPKPSPTVSLYNLKYLTEKQILGYKFLLFLTYYKSQNLKNPLKYFKTFQYQWNTSLFWARKLKTENA